VTDELYLAVVRRRIQKARLEKNLRQEDVADRLGISLRSYQRYESESADKRFNPYVLTLRRIARTLDVDTAELTKEPSRTEFDALDTASTASRASRRN
jgi:transcriptional regulator with XRE-family HTH domain